MSRVGEWAAELAAMPEPDPPDVEETMRRFRACAEREAVCDARRRAERLACLSRINAAANREQRRLRTF